MVDGDVLAGLYYLGAPSPRAVKRTMIPQTNAENSKIGHGSTVGNAITLRYGEKSLHRLLRNHTSRVYVAASMLRQ